MSNLQLGPSPVLNQTEDLSSYFNRSASAVQVYADKFEHEYARPALKVSYAFFDEHPISATFIAIFSILSVLPVLSFIGFSAFILLSLSIVAFSTALFTSAVIILASFACLLFTLFIITCISAFFTALAAGGYTLFRLATLVHHDGREGVVEWAQEAKGHLSHAKTRIMRGMPLRQRMRLQRYTQPQHRQGPSEPQWSPSKKDQRNQAEEDDPRKPGEEHEHGWEEEDSVPEGLSRKVDTSEGEEGSSGSMVVVKREEEESSPPAGVKEDTESNGQPVEPKNEPEVPEVQ